MSLKYYCTAVCHYCSGTIIQDNRRQDNPIVLKTLSTTIGDRTFLSVPEISLYTSCKAIVVIEQLPKTNANKIILIMSEELSKTTGE